MVAFVIVLVVRVLMDSYLEKGMLGNVENSTDRISHIVIVVVVVLTICVRMVGYHPRKEELKNVIRI